MNEVQCPTCNEDFAISDEFLEKFEQGGIAMFCPNGHKLCLVFHGMPTKRDEQVAMLERMWYDPQ